jgi:hypothetical protein
MSRFGVIVYRPRLHIDVGGQRYDLYALGGEFEP